MRLIRRAVLAGDPGTMVVADFLPLLDRLGLDVRAPAWLGWSRGGYGVLRLSAQRGRDGLAGGPVPAVSPALWSAYDEVSPGSFADEDQYDAATAFLAEDPPVDTRVDCGTGDPFYRAVREPTSGRGLETHFEAGGHTPGYWTRVLPAQLAWLAERVGGV